MPAVRQSDLAKRLGLDISTVSRALRGDPRVHPETRDRVLKEAENLAYRPHVMARALAEGRTRTVWFVIPGMENPIEREPAYHASLLFLERGYDLLVAQHHDDPAVYARILERVVTGGTDAAILIPGSPADGKAERILVDAGFPFAYLDRRVHGVPAPVVTSDNETATRELFEKLLTNMGRSGHLVSAVADGFRPGHNPVEESRSRAWRAAAAAHGLPLLDAEPARGRQTVGTGSKTRPGDMPVETANDIHGNAVLIGASNFGFAEASRTGLLARGLDCVFGAGVFDQWSGGSDSGYAEVLVVRQDFKGMAERVSELILHGLESGASLRNEEILVPAAGIFRPGQS